MIDTTEQFIHAASVGDGDAYVCFGVSVELRTPQRLARSRRGGAGVVRAEHWSGEAAVRPTWTINLSAPPEKTAPAEVMDVAYRVAEDGLCVVDVAWAAWLDCTEKDPCTGDKVRTAGDRRLLRMRWV